MNWSLAGQLSVCWIVLSLVASPYIGRYLRNRRTQKEFRQHLDTEARRVRLEKLVELADQYEAAETDRERIKLFRKATDLGFTADSDTAFGLDGYEHPHPLKAS